MIKEFIIQYPAIVLSYLNNNLDVFNQENFPGRVCRRKDFSEFALEQAFENIKNKKFSKSFKKNIIENKMPLLIVNHHYYRENSTEGVFIRQIKREYLRK